MIDVPVVVPRAAVDRYRRRWGDQVVDEDMTAGLVKVREEEGLHD